jgi:hypothetical protein
MGQKYNVIKSPYIELETPFTAWYVLYDAVVARYKASTVTELLKPAFDRARCAASTVVSLIVVACLIAGDGSCLYCREAFKMVLLLPTVPVRLVIIIASIIAVAVVNTLAILGW